MRPLISSPPLRLVFVSSFVIAIAGLFLLVDRQSRHKEAPNEGASNLALVQNSLVKNSVNESISNVSRLDFQNALGNVPTSFEVNEGQTDKRVKFLARGTGYSLFLTSTEAVLALNRKAKSAANQSKVEQLTNLFPFMRATFYRWIELWSKNSGDLANATKILAVGDLHVENFGTWRDQEGRLVWGINDFDEASILPYTSDLVRLAVSAHLAISSAHLIIKPADACGAILKGYVKGLKDGGNPFILAEGHDWLRSTVLNELRDPGEFWKKLMSLRSVKGEVPAKARKALASALPERRLKYRLVHRVAGLGSLGRQRFAALAEWSGGQIAREAKAVVPPACVWANGRNEYGSLYEEILKRAFRCPDPFLRLRKGWIVRRLAPDCSRVELTTLPKGRDEYKLLEAMGRETASVHLGNKSDIPKVTRDLKKRSQGWLHIAAKTMVEATTNDWHAWRGKARKTSGRTA